MTTKTNRTLNVTVGTVKKSIETKSPTWLSRNVLQSCGSHRLLDRLVSQRLDGIPTLLTVLGWAMLVKAFFVFTIPNWGLRSMAQVDAESSRKIIVPGVAMVIVSVLLVFTLLGE